MESGGKTKVGMLVETEIKLSGAAKEFGPQIGAAQERFFGAERIEMVVDGKSGRVKDPRLRERSGMYLEARRP